MPIDLFGVPWSEIELGTIQGFLSSAGEEGVTWEAKADDSRGHLRPDSIRKAACGLANQIGGYLFLGATKEPQGTWRLPGIKVPDREPELWIGKILRQLRPTPRFEAKAWKLPDGSRTVFVVQIEPVAEPPCMTPHGRVYERVSGETLPVEDPALLDKLFRRGAGARSRASESAFAAAKRALNTPDWAFERVLSMALSLAPLGRETDDISSLLFTQKTREQITAATESVIEKVKPGSSPDDHDLLQQQDAFAQLAHFDEQRHYGLNNSVKSVSRSTWLSQANWDGSVATGLTFLDGDILNAPPLDLIIESCWEAMIPLVKRLGGYGSAQLTLLVDTTDRDDNLGFVVGRRRPPEGTLYSGLSGLTRLDRVCDSDSVDTAIVQSLAREVKRAAGIIEDEPAPNS
jgi:hypothetical protein